MTTNVTTGWGGFNGEKSARLRPPSPLIRRALSCVQTARRPPPRPAEPAGGQRSCRSYGERRSRRKPRTQPRARARWHPTPRPVAEARCPQRCPDAPATPPRSARLATTFRIAMPAQEAPPDSARPEPLPYPKPSLSAPPAERLRETLPSSSTERIRHRHSERRHMRCALAAIAPVARPRVFRHAAAPVAARRYRRIRCSGSRDRI